MTIKKTLNVISIIFAASSAIILTMPIFSAKIGGTEMTLLGRDLADITALGIIPGIMPTLLGALAVCKLRDSIKTVALLILYLINSVAFHISCSCAYSAFCEQTGSLARSYITPEIYSIIIFLAFLFMFIACNMGKGAEKSLREYLSYIERPDNIIDPLKEKFCLCNRHFDVAKYKDNGNAVMGSTHVCFVTNEGYFAALNDNDSEIYHDIELIQNNEAVGFVMKNMSTGIFGSFYEDYNPRSYKKLRVAPLQSLYEGKAELWLNSDDGKDLKLKVWLSPDPNDIRLTANRSLDDSFIEGAAVIQDGKLAAIAMEYDKENNSIKCIAAELMASDLCRRIYEQRVLEEMRFDELQCE